MVKFFIRQPCYAIAQLLSPVAMVIQKDILHEEKTPSPKKKKKIIPLSSKIQCKTILHFK